MADWRKVSGVALGILGLIALGAIWRPVPQHPHLPRTRLLADCSGSLRTLVIQYVPEAREIVATPYRQFLGSLPAERQVIVICPDETAWQELRAMVGPVTCRLTPLITGHTHTCWSRDRWLAGQQDDGILLLAPDQEQGAEIWPQRRGDARLARHLAEALSHVRAQKLQLGFDGGDFVADQRTLFVAPRVIDRNVGHHVVDRAELEQTLELLSGRQVLLLPRAPSYHAGMYLMPIGGRTVLVGDPSLVLNLPGQELITADTSPTTQADFDAVAKACLDAGYRVVRMPTVVGTDQRTYLTWLNVILDQEDGRPIVYLPVYAGVPGLNARAARIWSEQGYTVREVDCTSTYRHFGSLRCLVNVLERDG